MLPRLIPVLLLQNRGLVKSVKFGAYKYIGDPINAVRIFNEKEVDELCLLDIEVSKQRKEPDYKLIEEIGSEAFIPFSYGGGITSLEQAKIILKLGAEKLVLNSVLFSNIALVRQIADHAGSQSVVASVDVKKNFWGKYEVYSHALKKTMSLNLDHFLVQLIEAGAGEILINSVDMDGTMQGLDLALIARLKDKISVPLVACGGAGKIEDLKNGIEAGADAIAAGSLFVFHGKHKAVLINYPERTKLKQIWQ